MRGKWLRRRGQELGALQVDDGNVGRRRGTVQQDSRYRWQSTERVERRTADAKGPRGQEKGPRIVLGGGGLEAVGVGRAVCSARGGFQAWDDEWTATLA
jgi:hypothetical protein